MTELSYAYGSLIDDIPPPRPPPLMTQDKPTIQQQEQQQAPQQKLSQQQYPNNSQLQLPLQLQYLQNPSTSNIMMQPTYQQQQQVSTTTTTSYMDKLFSKKKEIWKALQITLIIILALSIHFIIDHYMKIYMASNDLSFERDLFLRLLYPIAILFLLWNIKTFIR